MDGDDVIGGDAVMPDGVGEPWVAVVDYHVGPVGLASLIEHMGQLTAAGEGIGFYAGDVFRKHHAGETKTVGESTLGNCADPGGEFDGCQGRAECESVCPQDRERIGQDNTCESIAAIEGLIPSLPSATPLSVIAIP